MSVSRRSDRSEMKNVENENVFVLFRHHRSRLQQQPPAASSSAAAVASAEAEVCLPMAPPPVTRRRRRRSITKESASPARSPMVQAKNLAAHDADGEDNDGNIF